MSLSPEWRPRIEQWQRALAARTFDRLAPVPLQIAVTHDQLSPVFESGGGLKAFCELPERARRVDLDFRDAAPGLRWGSTWEYAWLQAAIMFPPEAEGREIVLKAGEPTDQWANSEPFGEWRVLLDGREAGSRDWAHVWIPLAQRAVPGTCIHFLAEAFGGPTRFGAGGGPCLPGASAPPLAGCQRVLPEVSLGVWHEQTYQLWLDVQTLLELRDSLDPRSLRVDEIDAGLREFTLIADPELPEWEFAPTVAAARERLRPLLACRNGTTAPTLFCIGHSHLDVVYQWPFAETERKVARTFSNQLALIDQYPEYRFLQSMPVLYDVAKRLYPEVYGRVQNAVSAGSWVAEGGMWTEADTNLPSGESLIRQFLHGRRFFRDEFGIDSRFAWLPDVFGYSGALPQIMIGCGMHYFGSAKIYGLYNGGDPFPYTSFWWEGIDGTRILSHCPAGYGAHTNPRSLAETWNNRPPQPGISARLLPYGHSDGGGGGERDHLEFLRRSADLEGLPRTRHASPLEFFADLETRSASLPTYTGEIYFALHRGTYTTQASLKQLNRQCETALHNAEFFASVACIMGLQTYPWEALEAAWKMTLFNQFHDILPGSCIQRAAEEANTLYAQALKLASSTTTAALAAIEETSTASALVFNSLPWARTELIRLPSASPNAQFIAGIPFGEITLPPCGWAALEPSASDAAPSSADAASSTSSAVSASPRCLENAHLRVELDDLGQIARCIDKQHQRDLGTAALNAFQMFRDTPRVCDAWDIDSHYALQPVPLTETAEIEVVASGPLVAIVRVRRRLNNSSLIQEIRLRRDARRIDFHTRIDWQERHKLLKVAFPLSVHANEAIHEIQFGHIRRPTRRSRQHEADQFEVCQQRWTALTEESRGAAILNDAKYGIDALGSTLRLTLLRSPIAPDPAADLGPHEFTYSLYFWNTPFAQSGVVREALNLNSPPLTLDPKPSSEPLADQRTLASPVAFFHLDNEAIILDTVKLAEDRSGAVILRLYESTRSHTQCSLTSHYTITDAAETNLVEESGKPLPHASRSLSLSFRPFEIKTLRLTLALPQSAR